VAQTARSAGAAAILPVQTYGLALFGRVAVPKAAFVTLAAGREKIKVAIVPCLGHDGNAQANSHHVESGLEMCHQRTCFTMMC
jgi:hypothetical protein